MASPRPKGGRDTKDTLCRNVLIYGHCRYEDTGCAFNHDQSKGAGTNSAQSDMSKKLNVDSPSFTPAQLPNSNSKKFTFSSQAANAAPFTPKGPVSGTATPVLQPNAESAMFNPAAITEFTPQTQNYDLNTSPSVNGAAPESSNVYDSFALGNVAQALPSTPYNPYAEDPNALAGSTAAFFQAQNSYNTAPQPIQYHLYAPTGPHRDDLAPYQRHTHDFFISDSLREDLQKSSEATRQVLPNSQLPTVGHYFDLVPLDTTRHRNTTFIGDATWGFKAQSKKDGNFYFIRRGENIRLTNDQSIRIIKEWRLVISFNVVRVFEAFTTRAFGDSSIILVYEYHPNAKTLMDYHFAHAHNSRYARVTPVQESVLWSYIVQIVNALKAIHARNLAARSIDATKIILTGKNEIRLSGCALRDVVQFEAHRSVVDLQQEDFIHLGRLIVGLATNTPPHLLNNLQAAVEQLSRTYSPELRERVVWLLTTPPTPAQKTVDEFARLISGQILTNFDANGHLRDELVSELNKSTESGRIARLLLKLGTINERPEYDNDMQWSETGERYMLKLFRDYVFHQVDANGNPVVDIGHMLSCLNKLDAGTDEKIPLTSRDQQSVFIVSYRELKKQVAAAFNELTSNKGKGAQSRPY